jgi:hypothetical protein
MVKVGVMDHGARDELQTIARNHLRPHLIDKPLVQAKHGVAEGLVPGGLVGCPRRAEKGRAVAMPNLDWTLPAQVHLELNPPGFGSQGKQMMALGDVLRRTRGGQVFIVHDHDPVFPGTPVGHRWGPRYDRAESRSQTRINQQGRVFIRHCFGRLYMNIQEVQ